MKNTPVIHWDATIYCRSRAQAHGVIQRLLSEEIDFDFQIDKQGVGDGTERWAVTIIDMPWGNNMKTLARIVTKEDARA